MSHIFMSYSRKDIDFAQKIVDSLAANDMDTWIDWKSIPKGEDWEQEIYRGIESAETFVFLMSPDSANSEICNEEISCAIRNNKRIIPIVIRDTNPRDFHDKLSEREISRRNWIFCRDQTDNFDNAIRDTIETIHTDYEWLTYHTKLQVRALEWERNNRERSLLYRGKELENAEIQLATNSSNDPIPTDLQHSFVLKSRQATDRQRRITSGVAISGVIALAMLAVFGLVQANNATNQAATAQAASILAVANEEIANANAALANERAKIARARELAAQSAALREKNFQISLLLGIEAYQTFDSIQTYGVLLENIEANPYLRQYLVKHVNGVQHLAFSSDSKMLASGDTDGSIIIWNAETGLPIGEPLSSGLDNILSISFSAFGQTLAVGSCIDEEIYYLSGYCPESNIILWDLDSRLPISEPITSQVSSLNSKSFDENYELSPSSSHSDFIILWHKETGRPAIYQIEGQFEISSSAFTRDGKTIVYGGCFDATEHDCDVGEIILDSGENILTAHTDWVTSLSFNPNGGILASGSNDTSILLWDVASQQAINQPLIGHIDSVSSLVFSPDGKILASGSSDNTIILWDVENLIKQWGFGIPVLDHFPITINKTLKSGEYEAQSVTFSPDGKTLALGDTLTPSIFLWDVQTEKFTGHLSDDHSHNSSWNLTFSPNGKTIASSGMLWNVEMGKPIDFPFARYSDAIYSVAFSPDGDILATGSRDSSIILWDVASRQAIGLPLSAHTDWVNSVAFSPDGKILASGSRDNSVILWNVASRQAIGLPLSVHTDWVNSVAFSPDGKILASGSVDDSIILWNMETGQQLGQPLRVITNWGIYSLAFSPDGKTLASGTAFTGASILWDINPQSWVTIICQRVGRNFTQAEWAQYFPSEEYRITCPQWPAGE